MSAYARRAPTWRALMQRALMERAALLALMVSLPLLPQRRASAQTAITAPRALDRFDTPAGWNALPSEGVSLAIGSSAGVSGRALQLAFDFGGKAGYAIARKAFQIGTPTGNWSFSFKARGAMRPNTLEFKLLDSSGDNVWWYTIPEYQPAATWTTVAIRQRQVKFAWGPLGGGPPRDIASIELVVTAGSGGKGTLEIDDLVFTQLPPDVAVTKIAAVTATGTIAGSNARAAIDGDTNTVWRARSALRSKSRVLDTSSVGAPTLTLDLGGVRTYGGLVIEWAPGAQASRVHADTSNDGVHWVRAGSLQDVRFARSYLPITDGSSRYVRLQLLGATSTSAVGSGVFGVRNVRMQPLEFGATGTTLLHAMAQDAPRGMFPRAYHDEQTYWAVVGVSGGPSEALLSEDGQLELAKRGPSLEPFLTVGGRVITWADGTAMHTLLDDIRPIPTVTRRTGNVSMSVTALASGTRANSSSYVRYRLTNHGTSPLVGTFWVALRPMQVNPPWQFLNTPGGAARVDSLRWRGNTLHVNGALRVVPLTQPVRVGVSTLDGGEASSWIAAGRVPPDSEAVAQHALGSAVFAWNVDIPAGRTADIVMTAPLDGTGDPRNVAAGDNATVSAAFERILAETAAVWASDQDAVRIGLPASAPQIADALKANLAWILINRDGPGIQPGSRSYERSWIRDGALTAEALLRLGRSSEAKEFAEWYAPFQFASGKVPCCVDQRGADPVDENDSNGEFIHLVHEVWRYTGDRAFADRMWPHVKLAAAYLDSLRRTHLTPAYSTAALLPYRGMLPPSISHEGYSAKPMHSYWDDGFALLGFREAAALAADLGHVDDAKRIGVWRDAFGNDLRQSLMRAMALHHIDYLPGSVELGDFDATSTTTLLAPVGALAMLPRAAVDSTFARYVRASMQRTRRDTSWTDYTPYEWRTVGSLVRLGQKDDALALVAQFMGDRRPAGWQQWAEVVTRDPRLPRFIGDMPHTWVGSDFIRSALDLFAYERETDSTMVIAAGVPMAWVTQGAGVDVHELRTPWGPLGYTITGTSASVTFRFDPTTRVPPGGFVVHAPFAGPIGSANADGVSVPVAADGTVLLRAPVRTLTVTPR